MTHHRVGKALNGKDNKNQDKPATLQLTKPLPAVLNTHHDQLSSVVWGRGVLKPFLLAKIEEMNVSIVWEDNLDGEDALVLPAVHSQHLHDKKIKGGNDAWIEPLYIWWYCQCIGIRVIFWAQKYR